MVEKNKFSNMSVASSSKPIPEGWKLVVEKQKNGSKTLSYVCPDSCQIFNDYEMLMRYVNYAKAAKLSIYSPDFVPIPWMKKTRKSKNSKKQKFPGKTLRRSFQHKNLPGKTIPRSARHQGNGTSKLKKSPEHGGLALTLEESLDELGLSKKDFRFKYFRRRFKN
ncbi:uncharacterized protein LOC120004099 isoform X2 [Tripterygium wilfordii]|nr:uncharacterized protein LOC120004099 isoform X2 [Tripterygium wilfordii]XP_038709274.1 uncharacterized protein LOC120004099 isoform X2 [Tripterygium wilfordii]